VKRNSLAQGLVGSPGRLATPRAGGQQVGMPQPLPPATRFGSLNPSITTGNRFSGGVNPGSMNLIHPDTPQTFQAPTYAAPSMGSAPAPSHALAPIIAALIATGVSAPAASGGGAVTPTKHPAPPGYVSPGLKTPAPPGYVSPGLKTPAPQPTSSLAAALAQKTSSFGSNYIKAY
jgi:hypothetical protein